MKTIKEKAEAYDELLVKLQKAKLDNNVCDDRYCCVIDDIVPELKESEGEKICGKLIAFLKQCKAVYGDGFKQFELDIDDALAWLEKQGEQKLVEEVNGEDYGIDSLWHAQRILEKTLGEVDGYQTDDGILEHECAISAVKKLYAHKSNVVVRRFLIGDTFIDKDHPNNVFTVTEYIENGIAYIDQSGERFTKYYDDDCWDDYTLIEQKPADRGCNIKEEDMTPFQKYVFGIIDLGVEQDRGLKQVCDELLSLAAKEIKQNPVEWSEEDERRLKSTITDLEDYIELNKHSDGDFTQTNINWLKSLKNRCTWKPSDEQMETLEYYMYTLVCNNYKETLFSLYQDLKKLKEQ